MAWLNISLELPEREASACVELLHEFGALSVSSVDAADTPVLEPLPGTNPLWERVRVCALFELAANLEGLSDLLSRELQREVILDITFLESRDWSQTWREYADSYRFGNRLWVVPTHWEKSENQEPEQGQALPFDGALLRLDPGLAFGTGNHATTFMCLAWLAKAELKETTVIDYGCGSGILALAAILLGAHKAFAIDYDDQALTATQYNATINKIENERLAVLGVDALRNYVQARDQFKVDIVLANILMNPLLTLSDQLVLFIRSGGSLVLSGILEAQITRVQHAYPAIRFESPVIKDGWACLVGTKTNE